jgi:hypothetical protein
MLTHRLLAITSLIYILCIALFVTNVLSVPSISYYQQSEEDPERNERSTPRSFILPSTPAVALEQEHRKKFPRIRDAYDRCLSKLIFLGYDIDDVDSTFNAKLIQAIIEFQIKNSINVTGDLDVNTKNKIGC